jgi:putative FmdB family regulatory protein
MPIYEYRCEKCGVFEETQRITDPALERCPTCRRKVQRLISSTSFQLRGSGWYATDYAKSGTKDAKKKEGGPAEPKAAAESKPATESKPAAGSTSGSTAGESTSS